MKKVEIGTSNHSAVYVSGEPGPGNAHHRYYLSPAKEVSAITPAGAFGHVLFQKGPVKEAGVNGCHNEDLLAIVIHRLRGFQSGEYYCRENELALQKLEEAMHWLNACTAERQRQGIEGTHLKSVDHHQV